MHKLEYVYDLLIRVTIFNQRILIIYGFSQRCEN